MTPPGGNGIASALPVFEELAAAGVRTQGLPALLIWASRKGHEFKFMAPKVLAAAHALGLNLTVRLNITGGHVRYTEGSNLFLTLAGATNESRTPMNPAHTPVLQRAYL